MWREFKEFAMKGSVVDLAIGIVIGAAFGKVVGSFVNDILMPPLGLLLGHVDFSNLFINLTPHHYGSLAAAKAAGAATINYGIFINTIIDFLIVSFAIFLVIREINRLHRSSEAKVTPPPPAPTTEEKLLTDIRDLLQKDLNNRSAA